MWSTICLLPCALVATQVKMWHQHHGHSANEILMLTPSGSLLLLLYVGIHEIADESYHCSPTGPLIVSNEDRYITKVELKERC